MTDSFAVDGAPPALRTVVVAVRAAMSDEAATATTGEAASRTAEESATPVADQWIPRSATDSEWSFVHSIARRHQVVPLVYEGLSGTDAPASAVEPLRAELQWNTKRNLRLARELLHVLDAFEDEGVRAIPFKGPVLAAVAYGDLNRRMFLDIDVLVHPDDVVDAGRVLRSRGYDAGEEFGLLRRFGRDSPLLADVSECSFHHADRGSEVELRWQHGHWSNPLATSFDAWWRRRESTTLAGRTVPVLAPEDRLLMLVTHANKHAWRRLAWLADVTASLRAHDDLDWDTVERRASSWGATPALYVAVALCRSLFGEVARAIPADLLGRVREDRLATAFRDRAVARLAADPLGKPSRVEEVAYDLAGTGSVRKLPRSTGRVVAASVRQLLRLPALRRAP